MIQCEDGNEDLQFEGAGTPDISRFALVCSNIVIEEGVRIFSSRKHCPWRHGLNWFQHFPRTILLGKIVIRDNFWIGLEVKMYDALLYVL